MLNVLQVKAHLLDGVQVVLNASVCSCVECGAGKGSPVGRCSGCTERVSVQLC